MKLFLLLILCSISFTYQVRSQTEHPIKFIVSKGGITDFVVTEVDTIGKEVLYAKAIEWISFNFTNKDEVIQSQVENQFVRFKGVTENITGTLDMIYVIDISFKDGRYKFDPIQVSLTNDWVIISDFLKTFPQYFKSDGTAKSRLSDTVNGVENVLNNLNNRLKDYIISGSNQFDDW